MQSSTSTSQIPLWLRYTLFVMQFLGAGFVAGSVVHFGEGVTVWDVSVLMLGVFLFTAALVYRETHLSDQKMPKRDILFLIVSSLFLSLTIGMASGGTQHFIDTPAYASLLIPIGITLGFIAFAITQRVRFSIRQWGLLVLVLLCAAVMLHLLLLQFNRVIPESIRRGHGSEHHKSSNDTDPALDAAGSLDHEDGDGHGH